MKQYILDVEGIEIVPQTIEEWRKDYETFRDEEEMKIKYPTFEDFKGALIELKEAHTAMDMLNLLAEETGFSKFKVYGCCYKADTPEEICDRLGVSIHDYYSRYIRHIFVYAVPYIKRIPEDCDNEHEVIEYEFEDKVSR